MFKSLSSLFQFKLEAPVGAATRPASRTQAPSPQLHRAHAERRHATAGPSPVALKVIITESDLPSKGWTLLTGKDGTVKVSGAMRKNIAVLALSEETLQAFVITKKGTYGDTLYLDVTAQLKAQGYQIKGVGTADSGFIAKLYESSVLVEQLELAEDSKALIDIIDKDLVAVALERGASDIHIELRETGSRILMRINGVMTQVGAWGVEDTLKISRVLFLLADEKTKGTQMSDDIGQSMSIKRIIKTTTVKLRVQTESAYPYGKDIVMRVLPEGIDSGARSMAQIGYSPGHEAMLVAMRSKPKGAIIFAGTTGSGKSTSLQSMMHDIRAGDGGLKMLSIEDPPEYILRGVTQIPVRSGTPDAYVDTMRHAMRMDPDVIMVGELRDSQTAALFTHMVQSGHKALTTLHASSGFGIIGRLTKMGLDLATLADTDYLAGLIYQTLVQVLCKECRREYIPEEWSDFDGVGASDHSDQGQPDSRVALGIPGIHDRIRRIHQTGDLIYVRGPGCPHCAGGITGRTVCAEMILPSPGMRAHLRDGDVNGAFEQWKSLKRPGSEGLADPAAMAGMTALDHAIYKMRRGELSPVDVEAALGFLTGYDLIDGAEENDIIDL